MVLFCFGKPVLRGRDECSLCAFSHIRSPPLLNPLGRHETQCPSMDGFLLRHNHIHDKLYSLHRHTLILLNSQIEYTFQINSHLPPQDRRRMDSVIYNIEFSPQPCAIDVFITSPYTSGTLLQARNYPAGATLQTEARKGAHYTDLSTTIHVYFFLVSFDTHGAMGKPAQEALAKIASFATRRGTDASTEYQRLVTTLSLLVLQLTPSPAAPCLSHPLTFEGPSLAL